MTLLSWQLGHWPTCQAGPRACHTPPDVGVLLCLLALLKSTLEAEVYYYIVKASGCRGIACHSAQPLGTVLVAMRGHSVRTGAAGDNIQPCAFGEHGGERPR